MRCVGVILVETIAWAAASPVALDQLFSDDVHDLGNSPSAEPLFDSFYSEPTMNTNDLFSSPVSSNPSDSLLYTEMTPGDVDVATSGLPTTLPSEQLNSFFDQDDNSIANDDLFGQLSQGEADSGCIPDVMIRGVGKVRLGRSCSELKEDKKSEPKTCVKERSQLCCCSTRGLDGVFNLGCNPSTQIPLFFANHFSF